MSTSQSVNNAKYVNTEVNSLVTLCSTSQKEDKECIQVKYLIYAVLLQLHICCNLPAFSAKSAFPKFQSSKKNVFFQVWYSIVWSGMVWHDTSMYQVTVWYGMALHHHVPGNFVVWYGMVWSCMVQHDTTMYQVILYFMVQY